MIHAPSCMVCALMAVFSTTGVDGVHLSAGEEGGNRGQCQVERCPDGFHRWLEQHINLLCSTLSGVLRNWPLFLWQDVMTVHRLTPRTRTRRPCSPSGRKDLWDITACVSRARPAPCSSPPLLPPPGTWRGVPWSSTSRPLSPHHTRLELTLWCTALIRWDACYLRRSAPAECNYMWSWKWGMSSRKQCTPLKHEQWVFSFTIIL